MHRKRVVSWSVAGALVVALGVVAVEGEWIPGPRPFFPQGSGVLTYVDGNSSIPPDTTSGLSVRALLITRDSAYVEVALESGGGAVGTLHVGETATFAGVTITLCDTWVNKWAYLGLSRDKGGTVTNASRAYYVQSTDGSVPECP